MPKPLGLFNTNRLIRTANNANCLGFESRVSKEHDYRGERGEKYNAWPSIEGARRCLIPRVVL